MNLTVQILISLPSAPGDNFHKSVIYICAHSAEGAMGIIINKSLKMKLYNDLLKQLGIDNSRVNKILFNYGGPVETTRGFILHSDDFIKDESLYIDKGIALTSSVEILQDISKGNGPKISMLALGYAGWGPDQLEKEISNNVWMLNKAESSFIFNEDNESKWGNAYKELGFNPYLLTKNSGQA